MRVDGRKIMGFTVERSWASGGRPPLAAEIKAAAALASALADEPVHGAWQIGSLVVKMEVVEVAAVETSYGVYVEQPQK